MRNGSAMGQYVLASVALMAVVAWTEPSAAVEKLMLKEIVERSASFELHDVTVEGTVRGLERLPPHKFGKLGCSVFGSVKFFLEDETGSIQVTLLGPCNVTNHSAGFQDDDVVRVSGQVVVGGRFGMADSFALSGSVGIFARQVNRLVDSR